MNHNLAAGIDSETGLESDTTSEIRVLSEVFQGENRFTEDPEAIDGEQEEVEETLHDDAFVYGGNPTQLAEAMKKEIKRVEKLECLAFRIHPQPKIEWDYGEDLDAIIPKWCLKSNDGKPKNESLILTNDPRGLNTNNYWSLSPDHGFALNTLSLNQELHEVSRSAFVWGKSKVLQRLLHLSQPMDAGFKTLSEAATIALLYLSELGPYGSDIIPQVLSYNAHAPHTKSLEFIKKLRPNSERVNHAQTSSSTISPPKNLHQLWENASEEEKQRYIDMILFVQTGMLRLSSHRIIGSVYFAKDLSKMQKDPAWQYKTRPMESNVVVQRTSRSIWAVSRIVSMDFIRNDRNLMNNIDRGPYNTSFTWVAERARVMVHSYTKAVLAAEKNRGCIDTAKKNRELAVSVYKLIMETFRDGTDIEITRLYREPKLSNFRIFPEDHSYLDGSAHPVDWDFTFFAPAWYTCKCPDFLEGSDWNGENFIDPLEVEMNNQLRDYYFERMGKSKGNEEWKKVYDDPETAYLLDVEMALRILDERRPTGALVQWLKDLETARSDKARPTIGLRDRLRGNFRA